MPDRNNQYFNLFFVCLLVSLFLVKLSLATVAIDIGNLKNIHILLKQLLYHLLVKFEQNGLVQTTHNFKLFDKTPVFDFERFLIKH